jgi:beta-glucosidase
MVVASRPTGAGIEVDRRRFIKSSLVTGSTLLANRGFAVRIPPSREPAAGAVAPSEIESARFPSDFIWGMASAAYQVEGAWNVDGKGESNWDRFSHTVGKIKGGATGDVACDQYHRYKEDIAILKRLNQKSYRFSTSWARIQPAGTGPLNQTGIDYYSRLVDALLEAGIRPFCRSADLSAGHRTLRTTGQAYHLPKLFRAIP